MPYKDKEKANQNSREYKRKNKDKVKESAKKYRLSHHEAVLEATRKWSLINRERENENKREYRKNNPDKMREIVRKYASTHPDVIKNRDHVRRAKRRSVDGGHYTEKEWKRILEKYGNKCLRCGSTENITRDHIVPLGPPHSDEIENIQPLCGSCNSKKGRKTIDYRTQK